MIARDAGRTPDPGFEVSDKGGQRVGYVDQASNAQGRMQAEALGLDLQRLFRPRSRQTQAPFSPSLEIGRLIR